MLDHKEKKRSVRLIHFKNSHKIGDLLHNPVVKDGVALVLLVFQSVREHRAVVSDNVKELYSAHLNISFKLFRFAGERKERGRTGSAAIRMKKEKKKRGGGADKVDSLRGGNGLQGVPEEDVTGLKEHHP